MAKSYVFRTLKDEIRRFWLVRPPERRTFADTDAFAQSMWELDLQASSSFENHRNHVMRVVISNLENKADIPTLDQVVVPKDGTAAKLQRRYV